MRRERAMVLSLVRVGEQQNERMSDSSAVDSRVVLSWRCWRESLHEDKDTCNARVGIKEAIVHKKPLRQTRIDRYEFSTTLLGLSLS